MNKRFLILGGVGAFLAVCIVASLTSPSEAPLKANVQTPVVKQSLDNGPQAVTPDPVFAEASAYQDFVAAHPVTAHAESAIRLLAIHKGSDFPLDHPNGFSQVLWSRAEQAEGQLSVILQGTVTPDGKAHPSPEMNSYKSQIEELRYEARRTATAEAIAYAIRKEPDVWSGNEEKFSSRHINITSDGGCVKVDAPLLDAPESICGDAASYIFAAIQEREG